MGVVIVEEKGQFGVNLGRRIVINGDFATRPFSNYFGQDFIYRAIFFLCFSSHRQHCTATLLDAGYFYALS